MAKHWSPYGAYLGNGGAWERVSTTTLASLRQPSKYYVISDAQLKRDLKPRTLRDVYRENRALRGVERRYVPRNFGETDSGGDFDGLGGGHKGSMSGLREEYLAWCANRGHTPHPASLDSDHPMNCHRETCPKVERISPARDVLQAVVNRAIANGSPVIVEQV